MRRIIPFVVALVAVSPVGAHPRGPCTVTILRAPDDVRSIVGSWVERETGCRTALEVRIIPTDGGLYLFARDERERIYERIVPDAQSAGVLIASWMADDMIPAELEVSVARPLETPSTGSISDPAPEVESKDEDTAPRPFEHASGSRWISLEGMLGLSQGGSIRGVRAGLDILNAGHWFFGLGASIAQGTDTLNALGALENISGQPESTTELKALIYAVRQIDLEQWHVRPSFGLGVLRNSVDIAPVYEGSQPFFMTQTVTSVVPFGELAFAVARDLDDHWAIQGGLTIDVADETHVAVATTTSTSFASVQHGLEMILSLGVGRRL